MFTAKSTELLQTEGVMFIHERFVVLGGLGAEM